MCPDESAVCRLKCGLSMQTPDLSCVDTLVYLECCELCGQGKSRVVALVRTVQDTAVALPSNWWTHRCLVGRNVS
jgi:hypothetical protein